MSRPGQKIGKFYRGLYSGSEAVQPMLAGESVTKARRPDQVGNTRGDPQTGFQAIVTERSGSRSGSDHRNTEAGDFASHVQKDNRLARAQGEAEIRIAHDR